MTSPTHATLATFRMDLSREAEQREGLERMIVRGVRQFPGFVTGHWTVDRQPSERLVLLTYDSLAAAEDMPENIRGNAEIQRRVCRRSGCRGERPIGGRSACSSRPMAGLDRPSPTSARPRLVIR